MSIAAKARKFTRTPKLFVHDLIASRFSSRRIQHAIVTFSVGAIVAEAQLQSTIAPLQRWLTKRLHTIGVSSAVEAVHRAITKISREASNADETAENLFIATVRAIADVSIDAALEFAERYTGRFDESETQIFLLIFKKKFGVQLEAAIEQGPVSVRALMATMIALDQNEYMVHHYILQTILHYPSGHRCMTLITELGEYLLDVKPSAEIANGVATAFLHEGQLSRANELIERYGSLFEKEPLLAAKIQGLLALYKNGFSCQPEAPVDNYQPLPGRVLHVLYSSLPFHSSGYATRSHALLTSIRRHAWDVSAVTRLSYPMDLSGEWGLVDSESIIDDIRYLRIRGTSIGKTSLPQYLKEYADVLTQLCIKEEPEILHAHSNAFNGLVANRVAQTLGIKSIYEVRGLWELTRIARQPSFEDSEHFELLRALETQAAKEADAVICITEGLRDEMVRRGVDANKIRIVPNGVDIKRFAVRPRDHKLAAKLGLKDKRVIGYVGSFVHYEGLEDLIRAFGMLKKRGIEFAGLFVGDGKSLNSMRHLVDELGLTGDVHFTGRIPHKDVERYYSLIDIAPFPRRSFAVTEIVSPLKPFEAMAMDKVVIASDVSALSEIIEPGVNGFLFRKDDVKSLAEMIEISLTMPSGKISPRDWVSRNRSWADLSARTATLYEELVEHKPIELKPKSSNQESMGSSFAKTMLNHWLR